MSVAVHTQPTVQLPGASRGPAEFDPTSLGSSRRFVGVSMYAAPVLMGLAAAALAADIGVPPESFNNGSWVEGIFGAFGLMAFIPVYLALANRLSLTRPKWAGVFRVTGLVGAAAGVTWESLRIFCWAMAEVGVDDATAQRFVDEQIKYSWPLAISVLFPLTSIGLGVALSGNGLRRRQSVALAGGGLGFLNAMAIGVAPKVSFAVGVVCWAAALFPLGREALRHGTVR